MTEFVPKQEVKRLTSQHIEQLNALKNELTAMKDQVHTLERAKQQVEQKLTDVHNYQESERGALFRQMEVLLILITYSLTL